MASNPMMSGTHARLLSEGLHQVWGLDLNRWEPEWGSIFEKQTTTSSFEDDQQVYGLGVAPRKYESENIVYDAGGQGFSYRYTMLAYALGVAISQEALEDNKYLTLTTEYTKEIAKSLKETQEILAANILNNHVSGSHLGSDGKSLVATDHVHPTGDSYSNKLAVAAAISETSIEDLLIQTRGLLDARGLPVRVKARKLIIPAALEHKVKRILMSDKQGHTANNATNVLKGVFPEGYQVVTRLTSTTAFWIQTDAGQGLRMFERIAPTYDTDVDFESYNLKLKGRMRCAFGWTNPMAVVGTQGA